MPKLKITLEYELPDLTMTKEKFLKEAGEFVERYTDDTIFFICDYKNDLALDEIGEALITAYEAMIKRIIEETRQADEEEG